jgi:hypothetical protein
MLYDGLHSNFTNFISNKIPTDPLDDYLQTKIPDPIDNLFQKAQKAYGTTIPKFSEFITNSRANGIFRPIGIRNRENTKRMHKSFKNIGNIRHEYGESDKLERYKPKDKFSFTGKEDIKQIFEPEWVINSEG